MIWIWGFRMTANEACFAISVQLKLFVAFQKYKFYTLYPARCQRLSSLWQRVKFLLAGNGPSDCLCRLSITHPISLSHHLVEICHGNMLTEESLCTMDVSKVRGLNLLLRVGTLWRCSDGLFFEVLLTTLHPLLKNVLQTVDHFGISCLRAPFSWLEKPGNGMGRDLDWVADVLMGFYHPFFLNRTRNLI
jgi:hypothetical protein